MKQIAIVEPTKEMLEKSIRNNIFYYYVSLFTWIGFQLFAIAYKDAFLWLASILLLVATINFNLSQKIDKMRRESMK